MAHEFESRLLRHLYFNKYTYTSGLYKKWINEQRYLHIISEANNFSANNFKLSDMLITRNYNQKILVLVTWLYNKKSTLESSVLAYNCTELDIPPIYKIIINKAVNYAKK